MNRKRSTVPTEAELRILRVLWQDGPSRLSEIQRALVKLGNPAKTTIATTLKIMEDKGMVARVSRGSQAAWKAKLTERRATRAQVKGLLQRAFSGSAGSLMKHLLEHEKLSVEDRRTIRELIDESAEGG